MTDPYGPPPCNNCGTQDDTVTLDYRGHCPLCQHVTATQENEECEFELEKAEWERKEREQRALTEAGDSPDEAGIFDP